MVQEWTYSNLRLSYVDFVAENTYRWVNCCAFEVFHATGVADLRKGRPVQLNLTVVNSGSDQRKLAPAYGTRPCKPIYSCLNVSSIPSVKLA